MADLRDKFIHLTNSTSWKQAEERFPIHAKEMRLEEFLTLNIKKSTPQVLSQFCAAAVSWEANKEQVPGIENVTKISNINHCTFVEVSGLSSLDPSLITSGIRNYKGSSLFMFYMGKVSINLQPAQSHFGLHREIVRVLRTERLTVIDVMDGPARAPQRSGLHRTPYSRLPEIAVLRHVHSHVTPIFSVLLWAGLFV